MNLMLKNYVLVTTDELKKNVDGFEYVQEPNFAGYSIDSYGDSYERFCSFVNARAQKNIDTLIENIENNFDELVRFESQALLHSLQILKAYEYSEPSSYSKLGTDESDCIEQLHDCIFKSFNVLQIIVRKQQLEKAKKVDCIFNVALLSAKVSLEDEFGPISNSGYLLLMLFLNLSTLATWFDGEIFECLSELVDRLENTVKANKHTLFQKMKILKKVDEYGFVNDLAWQDEKSKFSSSLLYNVNDVTSEEIVMTALALFVRQNLIPEIVESLESGENTTDNIAVQSDSHTSAYQKGMDYEDVCLQEFRRCGWGASKTQAGSDKGVDILATKESITVAIQCKSWSSKINTSAIQEVVTGQQYYDADFSIVITASEATTQAIELATKLKVIIIGVDKIKNLEILLLSKFVLGR